MSSDEVAQNIVLKRADEVRQIVARADFSKCPVGPEQKEVNLFIIDALTSLLSDGGHGRSNPGKWVGAGGIGAALMALGELYLRSKGLI